MAKLVDSGISILVVDEDSVVTAAICEIVVVPVQSNPSPWNPDLHVHEYEPLLVNVYRVVIVARYRYN